MDFSTMTKEQLREQLTTRNLPVSGTNPELIDRLNSYEAERRINEGPGMGEDDDLLADLDEPPVTVTLIDAPAPAAPAPTTPAPEAPVTTPDPIPTPNPELPKVKDPHLLGGNRYETTFPCPGELSTGVHQENLQVARHRAEQAGYTPRGGAFSANRSGFRMVDGVRHAVYELPIRKIEE